jgi:DnaJ-class molecular chaperone
MRDRHEISLVDDFEAMQPSREELLDRLMRSVTLPDLPKSQHRDVLPLEIAISPAQAASGGDVTIGVPVFDHCRTCRGAGHTSFFVCHDCDGSGLAFEKHAVEISLGPDVRDRWSIDVPLDDLGISTIVLRIIIRIVEDRS